MVLQVRQGLKTFSNWPTYPQLYVKGELVGGLDIVKVSPCQAPDESPASNGDSGLSSRLPLQASRPGIP